MQFVVIYWKYLPILSIKNSINDGNGVYLSCRFAVREVDAVFTLSEQDLLVLFKIKPPVLDPLTHCGLSHFLCKDLRSMQIQLLKGPGVATRRTGHDQNFLEERERFDCILCCAQRVGCRYLCQNFCKCQGWVLMLVRSDVHSEITSSWHFVCSTRTGIRTSWAPRQYLELGQLAEEV